jgi:soluble lytic murein transglycosylase-like protein
MTIMPYADKSFDAPRCLPARASSFPFLRAGLLGLLLTLPALSAAPWPTPPEAEIAVFDDGAGGLLLVGGPDEREVVAREIQPSEPAPPQRETASQRQARLQPLIAAAAARYKVPEALLVAVIRVESNFDHNAVSPKGAVGPMQLMPGTARYLGVEDIRDPAANIDAGARYLKKLLKRFGNDLTVALAAYNAGPTVVARNGGAIPDYAETRQYVAKVIDHYEGLQGRSVTTID